jgi:4-amino-4-deoxy-L-arabinose transferase-like glycosyltransferase
MPKAIDYWLRGDARRWAVLLVALGLLKGLLFIGLTGLGVTKPFVGFNAQDNFLPIADRLLTEGRFNGPDSRGDSKVAPLYPVVIAALKAAKLPGPLLILVFLQMLADTATALCMLWLGCKLSSVLTGGVAGLLWSLYPPAIVMSAWITQESFFTTVLMASIVVLVAAVSSANAHIRWTFAAGLLMGLATLLRATPLLIPVFLLPVWIWKRRPFGAVAFVLGMALLIVPWSVRNWVVLHDRILVATGTGSVILLGSEEEQITAADKKGPFYEAAGADGIRHGLAKPNPEYGSAIDRWLTRIALMRYQRRLENRPLSFVKLSGLKLLRLWYATDTATWREQMILALCSLPVVPLGLLQVWRWRKANKLFFLIMGGVLLYFIAMHFVLLPLLRYMIPVYPILILAAWQRVCEMLSLAPVTSTAGVLALGQKHE